MGEIIEFFFSNALRTIKVFKKLLTFLSLVWRYGFFKISFFTNWTFPGNAFFLFLGSSLIPRLSSLSACLMTILMTVTQWGYPFRLWTKSRCFTNYIQNLIPKILLNSYSPRKYFKISSKLWFMDRYLSRCKIQSFLKSLNFCLRENPLAKIKHFFWNKRHL